MADYIETSARSILRRSKVTDSWFLSHCGMNLYRGCEHACAYCDGRAEKYRVEGDFGGRIEVKVNAPQLLERELERVGRRGFIFLGGGVCDAYQPAEQRFEFARRCLELIRDRGTIPVHVLTKSALVERDADLLAEINQGPGAIVSFSVSTLDQRLADIFEPGCAAVAERFRLLELFRRRGLGTGLMLMPVLPLLSDGPDQLEQSAQRAREVGVDFVLTGGMTIKAGRQMEHMLQRVGEHFPDLAPRYRALYPADRWGNARGDYHPALERRFAAVLQRHRLAPRIPHGLYRGRVERNVEVAMVLAHIDHLLRQRGQRRPTYAAASTEILRLKQDIEDVARASLLTQIPAVGPAAARVIEELLESDRCGYYEQLIAGG